MPSPISEAILVNLLLDGELEALLRESVTDAKTTLAINARIAEIADKLDAPTREFSRWAIRRWAIDVYGIGR